SGEREQVQRSAKRQHTHQAPPSPPRPSEHPPPGDPPRTASPWCIGHHRRGYGRVRKYCAPFLPPRHAALPLTARKTTAGGAAASCAGATPPVAEWSVRAVRCRTARRGSLEGDGGAGALELLLGLVRGVLVDLLQDRLRSAVDEVLGLLQAEG